MVHRTFMPLHGPGAAAVPAVPASKRPRVRTAALFFFAMLVLLVLIAQLTVLEARTNPASAHPLARTFHPPAIAPGADG